MPVPFQDNPNVREFYYEDYMLPSWLILIFTALIGIIYVIVTRYYGWWDNVLEHIPFNAMVGQLLMMYSSWVLLHLIRWKEKIYKDCKI